MKTANQFQPSATAKEFIASLVDLQSGYQLPRKQLFIYRGVGEVDAHPLVPSAFRKNNRERLFKLADVSEDSIFHRLDEGLKQAYLEFRVVERFLSIADRAGLSIPTIDKGVRSAFSEYSSKERDQNFERVLTNWPPLEIIPVVSLAQHYGLPTRLLDWSYDVLTAAYFAAESALKLQRSSDQNQRADHCLAVWVCNPHELNSLENSASQVGDCGLKVEVHSPPKYENPNLMAQSGLFTWVSGENAHDIKVMSQPVDQIASDLLDGGADSSFRPVRTFGVFTLSWRHADELMTRLYNLGVSRAKLQPGFGGVAETLENLSNLTWSPNIDHN